MRRYFYTLIFVLVFQKINAQVNQDSLLIELDSILTTSVPETQYLESASKYYQMPSEVPLSINIINSKEIDEYGYLWLSDLLNAQKGLYISNDRTYTFLGVRGFSRPFDLNNRILLLIDGHRVNEQILNAAGIDAAMGLDLNNFERVEIVRGPGSALYGTSAMFAVINLIPKQSSNTLYPNVKLSYGTFNTKRISLNFGRKESNDFSYYVNGNYHTSDGEKEIFFEDSPYKKFGVAENLDGSKSYGLIGGISYKQLKLFGSTSFFNKDVPTAMWNSGFNKPAYGINKEQFLELQYSRQLVYNLEASVRLSYNVFKYEGKRTYSDIPIFESTNGKSLDGEIQFKWDIVPNNRLISGFEFKNIFRADYSSQTLSPANIYFNAPYNVFSFYLQDEYQIRNNLLLYLGLRYDSYSMIDNSTNPRIGLVFSPNEQHTIKLLYGEAFRAPSVFERESNAIEGFLTDPSLKSEKITSFELNWEYMFNRNINGNISLFEYRMKDLIELILPDVNTPIITYVNIGKTKAEGIELEINSNITLKTNSFIKYSYIVAKDNNTDKNLTNSPVHLLKVGISQNIYDYANFAIEYLFDSKRETLYKTYTKPNHLVNINLSSKTLFDRFKFSFKINNVLNKTITYPGRFGQWQEFIPQLKRNYLFTMSIEGN